jgi:hypothetical protein
MGHSVRGRACVVALAAIVALGVAGGCSSKPAGRSGATSSDVIVCGVSPIVDESGANSAVPEVYVLPAMNNKLRHYPDFAKAIGMKSVSSCDEARAFYSAYMKYFESHPHFDVREPFELPPLSTMPPSHPEPEVIVPKIYNGYRTFNFPVVEIEYLPDPTTVAQWNATPGTLHLDPTKTIKCSATFIAKNWIATAAHCIVVRGAWNSATQSPDWDGWYNWDIRWADAQGNIEPNGGSWTLKNALLHQIPDPDYVGLDPSSWTLDAAAHDFALLYVPASLYDGHLPADQLQDDAPPSVKTAMAVSVAEPDSSWNLTIYGYGRTKPFPGSTSDSGALRSAPLQPNQFVDLISYIAQNAPPPLPTPYGTTCLGDSGGPWVRNVTDSDGHTQQVLVGITSGFQGPGFGAGNFCGVTAGDTTNAVAVNQEIDFINETMQTAYGDGSDPALTNPDAFTCTSRASLASTNGDPDYAECWGTPCNSDCDCPSSLYYCSNPTNDPGSLWARAGCDACVSGCGCVVGQCLPRPDATDYLGDTSSCP